MMDISFLLGCFDLPCAFLRHRGKNTWHSHLCRRAGATPRFTWAAEGRKSGVAPARFGVFSTASFLLAAFLLLSRSKTSLHPGCRKSGRKRCSTSFLSPSPFF